MHVSVSDVLSVLCGVAATAATTQATSAGATQGTALVTGHHQPTAIAAPSQAASSQATVATVAAQQQATAAAAATGLPQLITNAQGQIVAIGAPQVGRLSYDNREEIINGLEKRLLLLGTCKTSVYYLQSKCLLPVNQVFIIFDGSNE